jgi:hypothetical protein
VIATLTWIKEESGRYNLVLILIHGSLTEKIFLLFS